MMPPYRLLRTLSYGLMALAGCIGLASLVWSAIPQGAPVTYTGTDAVTMPAGTTFSAQILNALGAFTASSSMIAGGAVALSGTLSPPSLSANQNDYNPANLATASLLRLTSSVAVEITGLATGAPGRVLTVHNLNALTGPTITLKAGPTASTDANEFAMPGDVVLPGQGFAWLQYDGTSTRWRAVSGVMNLTGVRATQSLAAGATIAHASRRDILEIVQISSTGGALTNTAIVRIAAGLDGQILILQGTSATNTYTIPDGNGVKWATGSAVTFDDRTSRGLAYSTAITAWRELATGAGGGGGGGTAASTAFTPGGGISATNVQTALIELDTEAEKLANKNANNGYIGASSTGKVPVDRLGSYVAQAPLSITTTVQPIALTVGVEGSGGPVTSTATPRIAAGVDGQLLILEGLSANTWTLPNGGGVQLCGNTGSVTVGLTGEKPLFKYNLSLNLWNRLDCPSLQSVYATGRDIFGLTSTSNCLRLGADASNYLCVYTSGGITRMEGYTAGVLNATHTIKLGLGGDFEVRKNDDTVLFNVDNNTGVVSGTFTKPMLAGNDNGTVTCDAGGTVPWYLNPTSRLPSTTLANGEQIMAGAYTFSNLHTNLAAALTTGQTLVWTLMKNGVATAMTCSVVAGAGVGTGEVGTTTDRVCRDVTNTVTVVAQDTLTIRAVCSGGTTSPGFSQVSMQYQ